VNAPAASGFEHRPNIVNRQQGVRLARHKPLSIRDLPLSCAPSSPLSGRGPSQVVPPRRVHRRRRWFGRLRWRLGWCWANSQQHLRSLRLRKLGYSLEQLRYGRRFSTVLRQRLASIRCKSARHPRSAKTLIRTGTQVRPDISFNADASVTPHVVSRACGWTCERHICQEVTYT
jgi:hypothetical protein